MTRMIRRPLVLLALLGLGLAGCQKYADQATDGVPLNSDDTASQSAGSDDHAAAADKLNGYIKGYNGLLSTFGLPVEYKMYAAQQISRKGLNDMVMVSDGWLDQALDEFKKARAIRTGELSDLDAAADREIAPLDQLVTRLKGLEIYYQSRGQLTDNFARGKREDPLVLQEFQQSLAAMDGLNAALDRAIARRDAAELDRYKQQGDTVGYDNELAMQKSKALIGLFHGPADIRNPAITAKADALVATIEGTLADERSELAKVKEKGGTGDAERSLRNSMAGTAADRLTTMIGHYRDFKASGNPFGYQMMMSAYNSAVDETNMGQLG